MSRLAAWYDAHRGPRAIVIGWLATRLLILVILAAFERFVVGDVFYYHRKINALFTAGLDRTLYEYPTPVVWILWLPYGASFGSRVGYLIAFVVFMLALDAVFAYALWRASGRRHDSAVDFWLIFVPLIGPLAYLRFDMLPAVLAGGALLAARRKPWVTGALTGLGAAIKLWPALLIGAFMSYRSDRRPAGVAFVVVGFGLALISLIFGGWSRLISPLTWQSDRGLQIESIWATPLMLARAARPDHWIVDISQYQAYEIFGPGVDAWVMISSIATVLGLAVIILLTVRAFRHDGIDSRRDRLSRPRHGGDHDDHQQDLESAVSALGGWPDGGTIGVPAPSHTRGAAGDQPDRRAGSDPGSADPTCLSRCSMTATLVAMVTR